MAERSALLVGSLPFEDDPACMRRALDRLGPRILCVPDGEVGEKTPQFPKGNRIAWVIYAIEVLTADEKSWKIVKQPVRGEDGLAIDYAHVQKLKPLRSPSEMAEHVRFGYDGHFRRNYPVFQQLCRERGLDRLKFQLGVPTGFALGFAFANPITWLRYTPAFNTVIAREVNEALAVASDRLVVQIEVPPELYAAYMLPKPLMGLALRPIHDLLSKITPGAEIGMHLCLGDFRNEAVVHPKTLEKMVAFSNRLVETWPARHKLAYMHYPFAEGSVPPTTDATYYRPLKDIRLPPGVRFVAGSVHEKLGFEDNARVLGAIESARGQAVDVACSCGLGRRTPAEADQAIDLMLKVIDL